jgi:hypothetical protein
MASTRVAERGDGERDRDDHDDDDDGERAMLTSIFHEAPGIHA